MPRLGLFQHVGFVAPDKPRGRLGGDDAPRELDTPVNWLVRAKHNRCLPDGDGDKLWTNTSAGAALGEITFTLAARDMPKAREIGAPKVSNRSNDAG